MASFHVGQMVVCVDDVPRIPSDNLRGLTRGLVYTIRGFLAYEDGLSGIYLEEITLPLDSWSVIEPPFYADRFRPVKRTNIDVFRKLVAPTPEHENA